MDFHHTKNKWSYTQRNANVTWIRTYTSLIGNHSIKQALDIGCGGGIYTKALAEMGIPFVTGVDSSEVMLEAATENCRSRKGIRFHRGDALVTGLASASCDLILERALIHHLPELQPCFSEAHRLLRPGGVLLIQDRAPEDCLLPGSPEHIRGYFFSCFPRLAEMETNRRHTSAQVIKELEGCGFNSIEKHTLWEVRQIHETKEKLLADLRARLGRSILHALEDDELEKLVQYIDDCIRVEKDIVERDRWTIWKAVK